MTNRHRQTWEWKDFSSLYISCSQWISRAFFSECLVHSSIASSSSFPCSFSSDYTCALFPLSLVSCVSSLSSLYSIRPVAATAKAPAKKLRTTTSNGCRWFLHLACLCLSLSLFISHLSCCAASEDKFLLMKKDIYPQRTSSLLLLIYFLISSDWNQPQHCGSAGSNTRIEHAHIVFRCCCYVNISIRSNRCISTHAGGVVIYCFSRFRSSLFSFLFDHSVIQHQRRFRLMIFVTLLDLHCNHGIVCLSSADERSRKVR